MEGSPTDSSSCQLDGSQVSCGGNDPCPAYSPVYRQDFSLFFFSRKLIGNGPARGLDSEAKFLLDSQVIDLDDDAINLIGKFVALGSDTFYEIPDLWNRIC